MICAKSVKNDKTSKRNIYSALFLHMGNDEMMAWEMMKPLDPDGAAVILSIMKSLQCLNPLTISH